MAIAYWNIVLQGRFKFLDEWTQFLRVSIVSNIEPWNDDIFQQLQEAIERLPVDKSTTFYCFP